MGLANQDLDLVRCSRCEDLVDESFTVVIGDSNVCTNCSDEHAFICSSCNQLTWNDDGSFNPSFGVCTTCFDDYYAECTTCSAIIHNDDANYSDDDEDQDDAYCDTCFVKVKGSYTIKNYSYKPDPIFYGSGLFLGIELEIDEGGKIHDNAKQIEDIANLYEPCVYCKHDSSLNDGFEIVTHPMDLEYHTTTMPWKEMFDKAISLGYKSHNTSTCGLHAHCNRNALGSTYEEQENTIARILFFIEKHWNEMLKFSRRSESQINRWAARYGFKDEPSDILKHAKGNYGRYVCINLKNTDTVEFRIFRGSLKYETFIATLQMVDEICRVAISLSDREFKMMSWQEFVARISHAKIELINYLKIKRLYVNEPVCESECDI